jgi:hypothetical protein
MEAARSCQQKVFSFRIEDQEGSRQTQTGPGVVSCDGHTKLETREQAIGCNPLPPFEVASDERQLSPDAGPSEANQTRHLNRVAPTSNPSAWGPPAISASTAPQIASGTQQR